MDFSLLDRLAPWAVGAASASAGLYILLGPKSESTSLQGARGLQNLGNTCFMNATLQALAGSSHFVSWMSDACKNIPEGIKDYMPMTVGVHQVMLALSSDNSNTAVHWPESMLQALCSHGWKTGGEEQDAHELFHIMLMALVHEFSMWRDTLSLLDVHIALQLPLRDVPHGVTIPRRSVTALPYLFQGSGGGGCNGDPFNGLLVTSMQCTACGQCRPLQYSHFDCLSLLLPRRYWSTSVFVPTAQLLKWFCRQETLEGVECDSCTRTLARVTSSHLTAATPTVRSNFTKSVSVARLPRCLCLQIQRLYWMPTGTPLKSETAIACPELLDMSPFTTAHGDQQQQQQRLGGNAQAGDVRQQYRSWRSRYYRLKSIVVHQGGAGGGHYVAYRRGHTDPSTWWRISDATVRQVEQCNVDVCRAYMVFYEKQERGPS